MPLHVQGGLLNLMMWADFRSMSLGSGALVAQDWTSGGRSRRGERAGARRWPIRAAPDLAWAGLVTARAWLYGPFWP